MKTIELLVVIFACCVIFSAFYWHVFHFVMLKQIRFQLFALRDKARYYAAEHGLGESKSFKHVERFACKIIAVSPHISLTSFLLFAITHRTDLGGENENEEFEAEAPKELVEIRQSISKFALLIMIFNSPWMNLIATILGLILITLGKLTRIGLYRGTEKFVDTIQPGSESCLQAA